MVVVSAPADVSDGVDVVASVGDASAAGTPRSGWHWSGLLVRGPHWADTPSVSVDPRIQHGHGGFASRLVDTIETCMNNLTVPASSELNT